MKSLLSLVVLAVAVPTNTLALSTSRIRTRSSSSSSSSSSDYLASLSSPNSRRPLESTVEEALEKPSLTNNDNNLSPFLQGMVNEQRELQMNVGKAMDVLRKDYPYFLKRAPDYSIYHDSVSLSASDGKIQLSKLSSYKKAFGMMRTMLPLIYDADRSVIQSRMVYDATKTQIRVSFNAMLVPKAGYMGMQGKTVHVDGISVYSIDLSPTTKGGEGKIIEHRIEKMLVNGAALQPPYFNAFGMEMMTGQQQGGTLAGAGAW
eukprot:CAMPEP_0196133354 /NCGR_PEP_ID=MMETSP0910-20130528/2609_1 /TAXON_ID=49265 /ORGANISM="Thalassiosira rotula, Strain GSO102" /LENGTH=260 /DNA_ID=CAMNT_0041393069 /DNA_START=131 /DNA_END=910 /DNA_ORIENTATION=-